MVNKKLVIVGLLVMAAMLVVTVAVSSKDPAQTREISAPNAKSPPEVQTVTELKTLELSEDTGDITCQQPPKGNEYGGIGGSENNPPKGTTISQELTVQNGRPTATGVCGTYQYIAGWWFNASEMAKLPSETLLYGTSPYAITSGSDGGKQTISPQSNDGSGDGNDGSGDGNDGSGDDGPIDPVPEVSTVLLVVFGILTLVVWRKTKNN